jgi:hypothetical protein
MKVNERKAADYIGIPVWTLRYHRTLGKPLVRYMNVEGRPWYDTDDLDAYVAAAMVERETGG